MSSTKALPCDLKIIALIQRTQKFHSNCLLKELELPQREHLIYGSIYIEIADIFISSFNNWIRRINFG